MISDAYLALNMELMASHAGWAGGGFRHRDVVLELITRFECKSVLDYGCGRGTLGNSVMGRDKHHAPAPVVWHDYDPCFPAKRALPISADLLVSTHVLEHVEPELLHGTLMEFARIAQRVLYIAVPHRPSLAVLPDGRNAHLIQESPDWWHEILGEFFDSEPERLPVVYLKDGRQRDETRYVIKVNHGNIG